jgi:HrpA-like RNA helicase
VAFVCSLAETCQSASHAGRETPGRCWRLYKELAYEQRPMAAEHKIQRFNLAEVVLRLLVAGLPQPHALAAALAPSCCGPQRWRRHLPVRGRNI